MLPAQAENKAPKIKATTIKICVVGTIKETPARAKLTTITNMDNNLYSAFKKS
jgi:hypothetical protein